MNINIKAKNINLTPRIKEYTEEKMDMLEKYLGNIKALNCDVEIEQITNHHKGDIYRTEVNIEVPGTLLRVEKSESDIFKAIDKVKDHLKVTIKKYKEKIKDKKRGKTH